MNTKRRLTPAILVLCILMTVVTTAIAGTYWSRNLTNEPMVTVYGLDAMTFELPIYEDPTLLSGEILTGGLEYQTRVESLALSASNVLRCDARS